jgi:hypothetical protein
VSVVSEDGSFELPGVAPGTWDVTLRGTDFADRVIQGVEIQPEKVADLGTVTVQRGRTLTGRVVEPDGAPVQGAAVIVAERLIGDGSSLTLNLGKGTEESMGLRRASTGPDGDFRVGGLGTGKYYAVAEHGKLGRSAAQTVAEGADSPVIELVLQGIGSVVGTVTSGGKPVAGSIVQANPQGVTGQVVVVHAGEDGTYRIQKLHAGTHQITAALVSGAGMSSRAEGRSVEVRAGEESRVDIDIPVGEITIIVQVQGQDGARVDAAQVLLARGEFVATTAEQLRIKLSTTTEGVQVGMWLPAKPASFQKVIPGTYTMCVVPLTGDMSDPAFLQRLQKHSDKLGVHCSPRVVELAPQTQTWTVATPPMVALPTDPPPSP